MSDPTVTCPHCHTEIRLTESLPAPLIAATRRDFEARLVAERSRIAAEEARRAQAASLADLQARQQEIADLRQTLESRGAKLAQAQKAEAEFLRQQRELDDARRELDVTVEKRISAGAEQI